MRWTECSLFCSARNYSKIALWVSGECVSFVCSLARSFIRWLVGWFVYSFVRSFAWLYLWNRWEHTQHTTQRRRRQQNSTSQRYIAFGLFVCQLFNLCMLNTASVSIHIYSRSHVVCVSCIIFQHFLLNKSRVWICVWGGREHFNILSKFYLHWTHPSNWTTTFKQKKKRK